MDFLANITKHDQDSRPNPTSNHPSKADGHHHKRPSNSELLGSAKMLADAAKSHLRHEPQTHEKGKLANAAADLLCGASEYGKLDESKGMGKYVDKAEDYLRQYHTTHSTTTTIVDSHGNKTTTTASVTAVTTDPEKDQATGGVGDYVKMAEGFLHKPSGGGGGSGAGDFMKMAGDFLKK